jgi:hypothetical protein
VGPLDWTKITRDYTYDKFSFFFLYWTSWSSSRPAAVADSQVSAANLVLLLMQEAKPSFSWLWWCTLMILISHPWRISPHSPPRCDEGVHEYSTYRQQLTPCLYVFLKTLMFLSIHMLQEDRARQSPFITLKSKLLISEEGSVPVCCLLWESETAHHPVLLISEEGRDGPPSCAFAENLQLNGLSWPKRPKDKAMLESFYTIRLSTFSPEYRKGKRVYASEKSGRK